MVQRRDNDDQPMNPECCKHLLKRSSEKANENAVVLSTSPELVNERNDRTSTFNRIAASLYDTCYWVTFKLHRTYEIASFWANILIICIGIGGLCMMYMIRMFLYNISRVLSWRNNVLHVPPPSLSQAARQEHVIPGPILAGLSAPKPVIPDICQSGYNGRGCQVKIKLSGKRCGRHVTEYNHANQAYVCGRGRWKHAANAAHLDLAE
jgi:hypothetical protein